MKRILLITLILSCSAWLKAVKTNVDPGNYVSIYNSAADGDTLLMAGGTYASPINFQNGKTITLKSAGTGSVIINFQVSGAAVTDNNCGLIFDGVVIDRGATGAIQNYFVDGSTFGNIKILAFRNDTIKNIGRCLVRGGNTTITNLETIEITNCFITQCGANTYCLLYPKFYVQNVIVKNSTLTKYYNGESFFRPQATLATNVLNFVFENNTVFKWSKSNSYALCYSGATNSTASNFTFRNNIITLRGSGTTNPNLLNATGGNLIAEKNLIVDYGGYTQSSPASPRQGTDYTLADFPALSCLCFPDTLNNDFSILSTSPLATAGKNGGPLGASRWIKTISSPVSLTTSVNIAAAGAVSPAGGTYNKGTSITLTATRNFGYQFKEWQDAGGNVISSNNPYTFTLDADICIKAVFTEIATCELTLNKTGDGGTWGNVTLSPAPVNGKYETGTTVSLTVIPNPVTSFLSWEDMSSQNTRQVLMDGNKTVTANFDVIPFIVGWDFASSSPTSNRNADYAFSADNTGLLNLYEATGTSVGWGASSKSLGGVTYNSARRYTNASGITSAPRYFQIRFSGVGYDKIKITSKVGADNNCVLKKQLLQYSIDGNTFKDLDTVDLTTSFNTAWVDCNADLPSLTEDQKANIYIRWTPDVTSSLFGDATGLTEGFYLANIFVFAEKSQSEDHTPPALVSSIPAENSTTASIKGNLVLTFDEPVKAGSANITFNGRTAVPVFGNKTVTIPYSNLEYSKSYSLTIPADAITDIRGNAFPGTTVHFTTMNRVEPSAHVYDAVVDINGKGDYAKVQDAINAAPAGRTSPWLIFIKNGTYAELIRIPASKPYIYLIGQDKEKVKITFAINCSSGPTDTGWDYNKGKFGESDCAAVVASASDFYAENISFENKYGVDAQNGPQALAFRSNNDRFAFYNCKFRSFQDTWYTSVNKASDRHYAYNCYIEGAVDYVYGAGDVFIDQCQLYNVRSGAVIVAPSHTTAAKYGYVFNSCTIDGNSAAADGKLKLGRPWQNSPVAVFLSCTMKILPAPEGWTNMGVIPKLFAEYNSMDKSGNILDLSSRKTSYTESAGEGGETVSGLKAVLTQQEASAYTYENVVSGSDGWNPRAYFEPVAKPANLDLANNQLTWDPSKYAICYVILRDSVVIGFSAKTSFKDTTAVEGKTYTYQVRAANEYGSLSEYSASFKATVNLTVPARQIAFPGAEGYGKYTSGGRGGKVIEVTNLNDSGAGSFREALTTAGDDPITVVFRVSGIIALSSDIRSSRSNMTIAGQTAPGDGICIRNRMIKFSGSNVIIRYLRFRVGDEAQTSLSNLDTENQKNVIIDHCSLSWSVEENHTCYDNKWTTVQWCILSEGLYKSYNPKGARSYGSQWGGQYATYHHNLIANNVSRSPRINGCRSHDTVALCDYRNNVIFNWGSTGAVYGGEVQISATNAKCNVNWINNYYKPGAATPATRRFAAPSHDVSLATGFAKWFFAGNYMEGVSGGMNTDNWTGVDASAAGSASNIKADTEYSVETVATQSADEAYHDVIEKAGAILPSRDAVDNRIIAEVKGELAPAGSGTFGTNKGIIDSQKDIGGWPVYNSTDAPADTDHDGMPDSWETSNGLDLNNPDDRNLVGSDGYTMLERYLNGIGSTSSTAVLVRKGTGASSQTINLGTAIADINYIWMNAKTVTVSGLPAGVTAAINESSKTVTISGTPATKGTFNYTISTTGSSSEAVVKGSITVSEETGIQISKTDNLTLVIYPNPVKEFVTIRCFAKISGKARIVINNVQGRQLLKREFNMPAGDSEFRMNVPELTSGMYFLVVKTHEGSKTVTFLKQ